MKFIVGLASGIVLGAAGAVAYSIRTGTDLRGAFEGVRSDIQKGDLDALGSRLERSFAELQTVMEERINQVKASTATAIDDANRAIEEARSAAASSATSASATADDLADAASATADDLADAASATADDAGETLQAAADDFGQTVSDAGDEMGRTIEDHTEA